MYKTKPGIWTQIYVCRCRVYGMTKEKKNQTRQMYQKRAKHTLNAYAVVIFIIDDDDDGDNGNGGYDFDENNNDNTCCIHRKWMK